jgi:hypothetical protein
MITGQPIAPLVQDLVSLDDKCPAQPQDALGDFPELHTLWNRRNLPDRPDVSHPTAQPQIRGGHLHLLGGFDVQTGELGQSGGLIGGKVVAVDEHRLAIDGGVLVQKGFHLFPVADADKDRAVDPVFLQLWPDLLPIVGIGPAVGSSHVPQKDNDARVKGFFRQGIRGHGVSERDQLALDVGDEGVSEKFRVFHNGGLDVGGGLAGGGGQVLGDRAQSRVRDSGAFDVDIVVLVVVDNVVGLKTTAEGGRCEGVRPTDRSYQQSRRCHRLEDCHR